MPRATRRPSTMRRALCAALAAASSSLLPACAGTPSAGAPAAASAETAPPAAPTAAAAVATAPPRLAVLVSVDLFRTDYLQRFLPALAQGGGFRRLLDGGAYFEQSAHTHTVTSTGPGHAALATGCLPARAGIIENAWIDPASGRRVYCVDDPAGGYSTALLERPTLGDVLQDEAGEAAQVVSVSFKDRTALLLGGRRSDASAWIDPGTGRWVLGPTRAADAHAARPAAEPAWLAACNGGPEGPGAILPWAARKWETAVPDVLAARLAGPDDAPGEDRDGLQGATFPHPLPPADAPARTLWHGVAVSPFCDELVNRAALAALADGALGRDEVPDLLCVGFSGMDNVGHAFGPDSRETLEAFVALDRQLALLLDALDEHVGAGRWTLALSSDHGIAPVPEQVGGLRVVRGPLERALEAALVERFGTPPAADAQEAADDERADSEGARWLFGVAKPSVYLDHARVAIAGLDARAVAESVAQVLAAQPGIAGAWTREQLADAAAGDGSRTASGLAASGVSEADIAALARDVHPTRSGDVLFLLTEHTVFTGSVATDHGSHHAYDRRVPVMLYGAGIAPGRSDAPAAPLDIAPTLARLLGLSGLSDADGRVLHAALAARSARSAPPGDAP